MKKNITLCFIISLQYLLTLSAQDVLELGSTFNQTGTVKACEGIVLLPGFSFSSEDGRSLNLIIDPNVCSTFTNDASNVSMSENYVMTVVPTTEIDKIEITANNISVSRGGKYMTAVQYFDAFGRPVQQVQIGATPQKADLVTKTGYDSFGRESEQWLPVPFSENNGKIIFDFDNAAKNYYRDSNPYMEIMMENSPLNRIEGQKNPGTVWHTHPTKIKYGTNNDEVKYFKVNADGNLQCNGNYAQNSLFKTENYDEDGKSTTEYKDKLGRVVMLRQANEFDTYYVYDNLGNLCYVLPPLAADSLSVDGSFSDSHSILQKYAYLYKYDDRNRNIKKRLPGCDWVFMVYDTSDCLAMSQDGNQRARNGRWTAYKYDVLKRLLYTTEIWDSGQYGHSGFINYFSSRNSTESFHFAGTSINNPLEDTGYSCDHFTDTYPNLLTVNYYDNYYFLQHLSSAVSNNLAYSKKEGYGEKYEKYNQLLTGSRTYMLNNPEKYTQTVYYYDYRGRLIQTRGTNHLGGYDIEYITYDFTGNVIRSFKEHSTNASHSNAITELYTYTYDHAGRLKETRHKLNDNTEVLLAANEYDELGRLKEKKQHNNINTIQYRYNIRNWITGIYDGPFEQNLYYEEKRYKQQKARYNGNITSMNWRYGNKTNYYLYTYDDLNRLIKADDGTIDGNTWMGYYQELYVYDKHGNTTTIRRSDKYKPTDHLKMSYNGNQLQSIYDQVPESETEGIYNLKQYSDINKTGSDFAYDSNGNMKYDKDRQIMGIQYNLLNLPDKIQFSNGNQIINTYTADGQKLKTEYITYLAEVTIPLGRILDISPSNSYVERDGTAYSGNIEYTTAKLPGKQETYILGRIHNSEGYVNKNIHHYYRKDHLGNNREVWKADGNTIATIQRTQYYPSGLPWAEGEGASEQPYKAEGKEYIEMHGYDMYDSFARMFDPYTVRTPTPDPHSENYYSISPYAWLGNNFVNRIDPNGKDYWSTNNPDEIAAFLQAYKNREEIFDFSSWSHVSDERFLNKLEQGEITYNDNKQEYYFTHGEVINGEFTITGFSLPSNLKPVSFDGFGYEGAFAYDARKGFMEHAAYHVLGWKSEYNNGFLTWNVNTEGRMTSVKPLGGTPPLPGKIKGGKVLQKMGKAKGNMTGNHTVQNQQAKSIAKQLKLNKKETQELHRLIGGEGYSYQEALKEAKNYFKR